MKIVDDPILLAALGTSLVGCLVSLVGAAIGARTRAIRRSHAVALAQHATPRSDFRADVKVWDIKSSGWADMVAINSVVTVSGIARIIKAEKKPEVSQMKGNRAFCANVA